MTGWFLLLGIALATLLLIWAFGMPRRFWMAPLAALMLGAAGYALQGSPDSPGRQVTPARPDRGSSAAFVELRQAMFGRFTHGDRYLTSADGLLRRGRPGLAITVLLSGISESPRDPALWTGLGIAYAAHDNRVLSPAALLAFDRALALAPRHPGPYFFRGLAHARAAEFESARQWWAAALRETHADAPYRADIVEQIAALDAFLALRERARAAAGPDGRGVPPR